VLSEFISLLSKSEAGITQIDLYEQGTRGVKCPSIDIFEQAGDV
jgi:hypothetical protein